MSILPTVKIFANNPRGWCIINESDFEPDVHERFVEKEPVAVPQSADDVAKLKKPDVIELLEAHDAEFDKAAKVDDLRDQLIALMFTDL